MRKRFFSILQYVIFPAVGILLVWWQLKSMTVIEKKEFYDAINHANYWLIVPIVIMAMLSHISRSLRWKLLMEPLGYNPKLKNVFAVTMVGYLVNAAIPRLGEILKCTFLARYEKLKVDKLVGTIIIERTFDLLCYFIFIAITVFIQIDLVGDFVKKRLNTITHSSGIPLWTKALIVIISIILIVVFIKFLFKRFPRNKIIYGINSFLKGFMEGLKSIKNLKHRKAFLLHTIIIWSMYLLQIYIGFSAMEATTHLSLKASCSVLALATLAMIATPGGIGSFPIFVGETLAMYSIAYPQGRAFGWLIWGVSIGIVIIAGVTALLVLPYINRNKNEVSSINTREDI